MKYNPSEPRPYHRRGKSQSGRWEIDLRGVLDNGLVVQRERRVFPDSTAVGRVGKRQAAAMALEEFQRWSRYGQVLRPGEVPALARTGAMTSKSAPTFAQFAEDFLEFCASANAGPGGANSPASLEAKEVSLRLHVLPAFGSLRMDQLTRRDVDRYVIDKTKRGRSTNSLRLDLGFLQRMLAVAKNYELVDQVLDFRLPTARESEVVALDQDEAKRFAATSREAYELRRGTLLELYLRTGLRCGEALGLYPADFDLDAEQPTVRVSRSWSKRGYGPTKGRRVRVVPLIPALAARVDELLCERGLSPRSTTEHPFSAEGNMSRPLSSKQVRVVVKRAGKIAATRPLHPHMLRHTFGTECARRGVPLLTIKEWMGHAKVGTTMRYLHLVAPDHFRWVELLVD